MRVQPWLLALAALTFGCGDSGLVDANVDDTSTDDSEGDEANCPIGSEGCPCTGGGGCDPGLMCIDQVCEGEATSETAEETEGETGECTEVGCECDGEPGSCDPGLICEDGVCIGEDCGNGALDPNEACDDGNSVDGDGCDSDCTRTEILDTVGGGGHTCVLIEGGKVLCWGENVVGQLGNGMPQTVGDNETPAEVGPIQLAEGAIGLSAGATHTCALFEDQSLRCWGLNATGQLGYGNSFVVPTLGDDESLVGLEAVPVGFPVDEVSMGALQTCARGGGIVRCWGASNFGQLGLGNTTTIGDDEVPDMAEAVFLGGEAQHIAQGANHVCALLTTGDVRCWGRNDRGQLGIQSNQNIGDDEVPSSSPAVDIKPAAVPGGATVQKLSLGLSHSCALFTSGQLVCWGHNDRGQLGQGNTVTWGDNPGEAPAMLEPIALGTSAVDVAAGYDHTCALLNDGNVRCWGDCSAGQCGYGDDEDVGDDETPDMLEPVDLGRPAVAIMGGGVAHTCAVLEDFTLSCWGLNQFGQLGYGFTHDIGDNEAPKTAGAVELY